MKCDQCNEEIIREEGSLTTGYGVDKSGNKVCHKCCGENDSARLANSALGDRFTFYLTKEGITNWPGTFKVKAYYMQDSKHNWGLTRTDVWFRHQGNHFHGYSIGHNTQILHVKRIK